MLCYFILFHYWKTDQCIDVCKDGWMDVEWSSAWWTRWTRCAVIDESMVVVRFLCFIRPSSRPLSGLFCRPGRVVQCSSARFSFDYIPANLFVSRRPSHPSRRSLTSLLFRSYHRRPADDRRADAPRTCFGTHLTTYSTLLILRSFSNKISRSPPSRRHLTSEESFVRPL